MASIFTAKDLEVYKDSLKEKKSRTPKLADKPPLKTPPSVKVSKPPLKLHIEEPLKERKPLSVVHKASNTIKDPHKPPSPTPVGSSKQADQWRKAKESTLKSPPPGKFHTTGGNPFVKSSEYKTDSLKSPREMLPSKSPHVKSDDNKATGVRKPSPHISPVYQKSPSLSGTKATPTIDVNASLCSECTRSASEGAVCFIGNDGRVSACTSRSAVRLCKNLNCAANNPEYVAAMANAPKKYLISKRHLLKAQFGPKGKTGRPKSPSVQQSDAAEEYGVSPPQDAVSPLVQGLSLHNVDVSANFESDDAELSLSGGDLGGFDEEMSLLERNLGVDKDDTGLNSTNGTTMQDGAVDEHINFSFHDGEASELGSPKFLVVESNENLNETHPADNLHEDAESLAIDSFGEPEDEDLDGSPMHGESKAEELSINYGDLMSAEEADAEDPSGNTIESILKSQMGDAGLIAAIDEEAIDALTTMGCEDAGQGNCTGDVAVAAIKFNQDTESILPLASIKKVVEDTRVDQDLPKIESEQLVDNDKGGCLESSDSGHIVDEEKNGNSITPLMLHDGDQKSIAADDNLEHSGGLADDEQDSYPPLPISDDDSSGVTESPNDKHVDVHDSGIASPHSAENAQQSNDDLEHSGDLADDQQDNYPPLPVSDDDSSGVTESPNDKQVDVHDSGITSPRSAKDAQSNDDMTSFHDSRHADNEDQSDEDDSEDDELVKDTSATEENAHIDAQEGKEDASNERVCKDPDGSMSNTNTRRQRRRRALRIVEEVSPETVILRKQQMLERKQAEEWMLNHAIEGVVHKLAPTGDAKVKILVEAFESIISHTEVEMIDTHNARQEKRTVA